MTEREKPRHGEIRQTACEMAGDAYRVEYTLYLDPRVVYVGPLPHWIDR